MTHQTCTHELADIRADIARLKLREAALEIRYLQNPVAEPKPRPGWPIRRKTATAPH